MTAATVHCHDAGLFSLINKVVTCLGLYEIVHVDFSKGDRCLYGDGDEMWSALFLPTEPNNGETIYGYPDSSITSVNVSALYGSSEWRQRYHDCWTKLRVQPEIILAANQFVMRHWANRDVVSVLVRATTHCSEQIGNRTQSLEEYAQAFERIRKPDSMLHVMACDNDTIEWFRNRYDISCYPYANRTESREKDYHLHRAQTVQDAITTLTEVLILSRSRALIHPISNMATAALYINPEMESIYLR